MFYLCKLLGINIFREAHSLTLSISQQAKNTDTRNMEIAATVTRPDVEVEMDLTAMAK